MLTKDGLPIEMQKPLDIRESPSVSGGPLCLHQFVAYIMGQYITMRVIAL